MSGTLPIAAQAGLVAAFTAGDVGGAPGPIERLDTHLSHIFLTGAHAFKLKKAVELPFVDFRTLEQRQAACEAELELNRRLAPALYRAVRPVTLGPSGRYRLGGDGRIVDWVVDMRRFDGSQQFDRLAQSGALTEPLVSEVAESVARMHRATAPTALAGHAADYKAIIEELGRTEAHGAALLDLGAGSSSLLDALARELARCGPLIERRRSAGKVRRGHGDLHLSNICVFEGHALPFDALEFDDRMATNDVLYDLAFLLMDLRRFCPPAQANVALNTYWDTAIEDEEGLALIPFFMALRAAVLTAVCVEQARLAEAARYRQLGLEMLRLQQPLALAIGGPSGSGKSTVAKALAARLPGPVGARLLRTDILRKRSRAPSLTQRLAAQAYAPPAREAVYRLLAARTAQATLAHASVIADGTFQSADSRATIETVLSTKVRCYWLDAPLDVRLSRIASRSGDPSDADASVAKAQRLEGELGPQWRRLDAARPVDDIVNDITLELLAVP